MNSGISFPEPHATYSGLKSEDFGSVFCYLGTFSAHSLLWLLSLNSGKWAVSNTFLTGALEKTGCHFLGKQLLSLHIQVPINVCGHLDISVAHVLLHILQGAAAVEKQACAAMPLRYNYDKPEKPRRIKGFEVFSLVFSSFSKPKNHTEISRIIGGVSLTTNE